MSESKHMPTKYLPGPYPSCDCIAGHVPGCIYNFDRPTGSSKADYIPVADLEALARAFGDDHGGGCCYECAGLEISKKLKQLGWGLISK